jgi:hypothetical protein
VIVVTAEQLAELAAQAGLFTGAVLGLVFFVLVTLRDLLWWALDRLRDRRAARAAAQLEVAS